MARKFDFKCENCNYIILDVDVNSKEFNNKFNSNDSYICPRCFKKSLKVDFESTYSSFSFKINGYSYNNEYKK